MKKLIVTLLVLGGMVVFVSGCIKKEETKQIRLLLHYSEKNRYTKFKERIHELSLSCLWFQPRPQGKAVKIQEVAEALGVRYVLEGSITKSA